MPADDGGSPITAYRVVMLQGAREVTNENITDPAAREMFMGGLDKNTFYTVEVYARNYVFEGDVIKKTLKTKLKGGNSFERLSFKR